MKMVRFLNTDNGQVIEATGSWIERYDRACNMQRVEPEVEVAPAAPEPAKPKANTTKPKAK